jgi:hypothetical protein
MSTGSATPAAAAAPLSEPARIVNTFVAPSKTFTDLRRVSRWWSPWLVLAVFSYLFIAAAAKQVGFEQITQNQMRLAPKRAEQIEKLPPEERARAMEQSVAFTKGISYTFPLINLAWLAMVALVLLATFKFGAGADVPFKTSLAIVMYASLPGVLKVTLAVVALLTGMDPEGFTFQNPVATNLGYFVDPVSSHFLYSVGTALDLFMIWSLVLTGIGFSCVSKVRRATTVAVVFGWYAVFTLVAAGLGSMFS